MIVTVYSNHSFNTFINMIFFFLSFIFYALFLPICSPFVLAFDAKDAVTVYNQVCSGIFRYFGLFISWLQVIYCHSFFVIFYGLLFIYNISLLFPLTHFELTFLISSFILTYSILPSRLLFSFLPFFFSSFFCCIRAFFFINSSLSLFLFYLFFLLYSFFFSSFILPSFLSFFLPSFLLFFLPFFYSLFIYNLMYMYVCMYMCMLQVMAMGTGKDVIKFSLYSGLSFYLYNEASFLALERLSKSFYLYHHLYLLPNHLVGSDLISS